MVAAWLGVMAAPASGIDVAPVQPPVPAPESDAPALAGDSVGLPDGRTVVLPKDFDDMTTTELAVLGIVPGMGPGTTAGGTTSRPEVRPQNATSCGLFVCTEVTGNGTLVYSWLTQLKTPKRVCSFAAFWVRGDIVATSTQVCGTKLTAYMTSMPRRFSDGSKLCNSWVNYSEKRCITIKA
jgi:hypothetical protein